MYAPVGCRAAKNFLPANGQLTAVTKSSVSFGPRFNAKCTERTDVSSFHNLALKRVKVFAKVDHAVTLGDLQTKEGISSRYDSSS